MALEVVGVFYLSILDCCTITIQYFSHYLSGSVFNFISNSQNYLHCRTLSDFVFRFNLAKLRIIKGNLSAGNIGMTFGLVDGHRQMVTLLETL